MKKILFTGFESFGPHQKNITEYLAKKLNQKIFGDFTIQGEVLPVSYQATPNKIKSLLEELSPSCIIATGIAGNRKKISLELVAINYLHADLADNDGVIKSFETLNKQAPPALFSTLPLKELLHFCQQNNIDAELSSTAGTYLCNLTMFQFLNWNREQTKTIPCGFIHYPPDISEDVILAHTTKILEFLSSFHLNE